MSIRLIREALDYAPADLKPSARFVLFCLAEDARDDRIARYSSRERLCKRTGLSRSQVVRIINELEDRGLIRRQGKAHKGQIQQYRIAQLHAHHQAATVHYLNPTKGTHTRDPIAEPKASH